MTDEDSKKTVETDADSAADELAPAEESPDDEQAPSMDAIEADLTTRDADVTADQFLDLESDLAPTAATEVDDSIVARVTGAGRVDADAVPDAFPVDIETDTALAIELSVRDETVTTFFEYPDSGTNERLGRWLATLEIDPGAFADLNGQRVLLTVEEGFYVPIVPDHPPRGSRLGIVGILAGLAFSAAFYASLLVGFVSLWWVVGFALVTLVVLPAVTALDAWSLATETDWRQSPWFWSVLLGIPPINVPAGILYLYYRRQARSLTDP
ncbi:hypothetical protein [Natranaeroarchaeum aerophilus]|uniref:Uncharacterized protein n=1 Tax=Natranaeroarchaeum aerophilus TaxID=2917711 RepID=A0AAE3K7W2_9EURY|nr:hypothetical protein [Natranaeroarchaeum aerophilus]MCL9814349.1 hypothetical protein [Natranaeroarchaeum aerophilus]